MDALAQYSSGEGSEAEESSSGATASLELKKQQIVVAPAVQTKFKQPDYLKQEQRVMLYNMPAESTLAPVQGPEHPYRHNSMGSRGIKNDMAGSVEQAHIEDVNFVEQFHTFHNYGYGRGASGELIGDAAKAQENKEDSVFTMQSVEEKKDWKAENRKRKRAEVALAGTGNADDPWAEVEYDEEGEAELTEEQAASIARAQGGGTIKEDKAELDDDVDFDRMTERKISHLLPPRLPGGHQAIEAKSTFHGDSLTDYQGRSWIDPPADEKPGDLEHAAFIPKKCIHKWVGHSKGVQCIELFPEYGHLLLSGSMDNKVKIWDVNNKRECLRTYTGHSQGVRSIKFAKDGSRFLSSSFDRYVRLWDTETGDCLGTYSNRKVPYCCAFYPKNENLIVFGESNNKIIQIDTRSGKIVQEYNHHLQAVNSITFVDGARRFVSTSDDKKILIWEWNIPVPIKYISEPDMHSVPAVTVHPSGQFFVGQSMDNKIITFGATNRFKQMRKKVSVPQQCFTK
jgi:pre-mRNA-processing factor 17